MEASLKARLIFLAVVLSTSVMNAVSAEMPYIRYNSGTGHSHYPLPKDTISIFNSFPVVIVCQLLLNDSRIYCYSGGYAKVKNGEITPLGDHYYLDVSKDFAVADSYNSWVKVPDPTNFITEATTAFVSVKLSDTSVLINGGTGINNGVDLLKNQTVVYHANSNQWETVSTMSSSGIKQTYYSSGALSADNTVVFWGGVQTIGELLPTFNGTAKISIDSKQLQWSLQPAAAAPGYPRYGHTATADKSGRLIYFIGGRDIVRSATGTYTRPYSTFTNVLVYHTDTGAWEQKAASSSNPPTNRMSHTATLIPSTGEILIYGGAGPDTAGNRIPSADYIHIYNPAENTFRPVNIPSSSPSGAGARYGHSAVLKNNLLYIIFGIDSTLSATADFHVLDLETFTWQQHVRASNVVPSAGINSTTDKGNTTTDRNNSNQGNTNDGGINGKSNNNNSRQPRSSDASNSNNGPSAGEIAGICIGVVAAIAFVAAGTYFFMRRRRRQNEDTYPTYWDVTSIDEIAAAAAAAAIGKSNFSEGNVETTDQNIPHQQFRDKIASPVHTASVQDLSAPKYPATTLSIGGSQELNYRDTVWDTDDAHSPSTVVPPITSSTVYSKPDTV